VVIKSDDGKCKAYVMETDIDFAGNVVHVVSDLVVPREWKEKWAEKKEAKEEEKEVEEEEKEAEEEEKEVEEEKEEVKEAKEEEEESD